MMQITDDKRGIYVASKTRHADRWLRLRSGGYPIISTWIDEAGVGESADLSDLWRRCISEASTAAVLLLYREPEDVLKGGWVELGAALACGVPVVAVGIQNFTIAKDARIRHFASLDSAIPYALGIVEEHAALTAAVAAAVQEGEEPVGYVTADDLSVLRCGVSCVDLFGKVVPKGFEMVPVYAHPAPAHAGVVESQETVTIPKEPTDELLRSMAIRFDHGLGMPGYYDQQVFGAENVGHQRRMENTMRMMRQLHEEVVGTGFYRRTKGEVSADPKTRILALEAVTRSICEKTGLDPAEGIMMLLTAAVHMNNTYSRPSSVKSQVEALASALGAATVAADGFFTLRDTTKGPSHDK